MIFNQDILGKEGVEGVCGGRLYPDPKKLWLKNHTSKENIGRNWLWIHNSVYD